MNIEKLIAHIKWAEGSGPYHEDTNTYHLYPDPVGKQTIGWGHNIEDRGLDGDVVELQLRKDISDVLDDCKRLDFWNDLDPVRQLIVADLIFNMGASTFNKFVNTQAALRMGDYTYAAREMENSRWFRQTGRRARKLVAAMKTGYWEEGDQG